MEKQNAGFCSVSGHHRFHRTNSLVTQASDYCLYIKKAKTFPCSEGKPSQNMLKLIFLNQFLNFYLLKENIISLLSETLNATKNKRLLHYTVEMENYRCCSTTSHHCSFKLFLLLKVAYKVSQTHARCCCVTRILVVYTHF